MIAKHTAVEQLERRQLLAGDGLSGVYFDNVDFTGANGTRVDATVNLTSSTTLPVGVGGSFSARWAAEFVPTTTANHRFRATTSDGVRLWVDDKLVIDQWAVRASYIRPVSPDVALVAGRRVRVVMEYFNDATAGGAVAKLEVSTNGGSTYGVVQQSALHSNHRDLPADAGWVNVRDYGAVGDGIHDDTQNIRDAFLVAKRLYFPNGTYRVTDQITLGTTTTNAKYTFMQGMNRDNAVIRLDDNLAAFQSVTVPKPVISFYEGTVSHQDAFRNSVNDLTISVGRDNPGAAALRFTASNQGGVFNVNLIAEPDASGNRDGRRGLDLTKKETGPELFKDILIRGFDYGVEQFAYGASTTWENITFDDQNLLAIKNDRVSMFMRHVVSRNTVPFYDDGGTNGRLVLLDSVIQGGGTGTAITTDGRVFIRDTVASGYTKYVDHTGSSLPDVTNASVLAGEFASVAAVGAFAPVQPTTLNLPILETPELDRDPSSNWVVVPNVSGDDTAAIRQAIVDANAAGKKTIYFIGGQTYTISDTIEFTGGIERIFGNEATIEPLAAIQGTGKPVFKFGSGLTKTNIVMERFHGGYPANGNQLVWVEHNTSKNVVLKHLILRGTTPTQTPSVAFRTGASGTGKLFVEDVTSANWNFGPDLEVYARQINPESRWEGVTNITNDGGDLWILGLKSEGPQVVIDTNNGGRTELLGGYIAANDPVPTNRPAFIVNNASFSGLFFNTTANQYTTVVREMRGTTVADYVLKKDPWFYNGYV